MSLPENSLADTFCMKGGDGENSYDANSSYQRSVYSDVQHVVVDSIKNTVINLNFPKHIKVGDLGCSSGRNTFLAMSDIVNTIINSYEQNGQNPPEIDCCLNDLPENDFNTVFKLVPHFHENIKRSAKEKCFVSGVPGSFYSRLFPSQSLHFVHSHYSLHWLSKVPEGLEKNTKSLHIGPQCPPNIYKSYLNQFKNDFSSFLRMRSEEIASNGEMVLTLIGRKVCDPLSTDCFQVWSSLSNYLLDLVSKGIVKESEMESFNIPFYNPNEEELREIIEKEGSFKINKLENPHYITTYELIEKDGLERSVSLINETAKEEANCTRSVVEPLFRAHFGEALLDPIFNNYVHYVTNELTVSPVPPSFTQNIVLSLTRK